MLPELLQVAMDWQTSFYLGPKVLTKLLRSVKAAAQAMQGVSRDHIYILEMVWLAMVEYLNDLTLAKEVLGSEGLKRVKLDRVLTVL